MVKIAKLRTIRELLDYAERRCFEPNQPDPRYWAGYIDGLKRAAETIGAYQARRIKK